MDQPVLAAPHNSAAETRYPICATILIGLILAVKLGLLLWLGPIMFPDSQGYVTLGDAVAHRTGWLWESGWGTEPTPLPLLRPYGYPFLIALAKLVSANHFATIIGAVQCVVSAAAIALVSRALPPVIASPGIRYGVLVLIALSGSSLFDSAVLSDSIYASIFVAVTFLIARQMIGPSRLTGSELVVLGFLWGFSTWVRDVGVYFTIFPVLGLIVAGRLRDERLGRMLAILGLFLAPVALMDGLYVAWNMIRTGHAFFSISGSINWLWPSFNVRALGLADPFDGDDVVARIVRSRPIEQSLPGMYQVMEVLWHDYGLDPLQIKEVTFRQFTSLLAHHPFAYLASVIYNVRWERLADYLLNPLANLNDFLQLGPVVHHRVVPGTGDMRDMLRHQFGLTTAVIVAVVLGSKATALTGLAGIFAATPILCLQRWRAAVDRVAAAVAYQWLIFVGFIGAYALVHTEVRLYLPVVPAALLCGGYCLDRIRRARRGWATG